MRKLIAGIVTLFLSFNVMADNHQNTYIALGVSVFDFDDGVDSVSPINIYGRIGYDFNRYIGIGFEGGSTIMEDKLSGVKFGVNTLFAYLRGNVPLGPKSKIYALVGPSNVELKGSAGGNSVKVDDDDTAFGVGFEYAFDGYSANIDYIKYYDENGVDVGAINIGLVGYF